MCLICDRIEMIKNGTNKYFVKETGYVVIGDYQHFKEYSLFLFKEHKTELFQLDHNTKMKFLEEMSLVAEAVSKKECDSGILICRSGHGMTIVANKFKRIRAANIQSEEESRRAKADDNINIIALSGDNMEINQAVRIIRTWIATEFKGGRYQERIDMLENIENENMK